MFCRKCGNEILDGAVYCPNCGQTISAQIPNVQTAQPQNRSKILKILIPTVLLVSAIGVVSVIFLLSGSSYKRTLNNCYKAIETHDVKLMRSVLAQYFIDYELADYDTDEYLEEDIGCLIDDSISNYGCGDNIKITYSVIREKDADKSDLEALKTNIYSWYAYYVYDKDEFFRSVTAAKAVTLRLRVNGSEDSNVLTSQVLLIREEGKWKIAAGAIDNSFFSNY